MRMYSIIGILCLFALFLVDVNCCAADLDVSVIYVKYLILVLLYMKLHMPIQPNNN